MSNTKPTNRSAIGMAILIFGLTAYAFAAAAIGELFGESGLTIQTLYYSFAGIIWIFPVKKLLVWIEEGHKKRDE
ncbi:hypothetical protein GCM10017044_17540 [Kordiimonas sediminis]|uniref:DUF2842 domain-containing protein n=1 Tax=Kordiimonas sediminis TaxID=1735581 RepID=A0A919ASM9_9PROT|nr:DUF2842 domain-containing protein [Kordiimonas sediminis]GHF23499.1 hypothetical protein GCM10017044_17540 [Kordiimonas sediminis]